MQINHLCPTWSRVLLLRTVKLPGIGDGEEWEKKAMEKKGCLRKALQDRSLERQETGGGGMERPKPGPQRGRGMEACVHPESGISQSH